MAVLTRFAGRPGLSRAAGCTAAWLVRGGGCALPRRSEWPPRGNTDSKNVCVGVVFGWLCLVGEVVCRRTGLEADCANDVCAARCSDTECSSSL